MLDNDTYLMVAIFQQAYQAGEFISDPVVYAKQYKFRNHGSGPAI